MNESICCLVEASVVELKHVELPEDALQTAPTIKRGEQQSSRRRRGAARLRITKDKEAKNSVLPKIMALQRRLKGSLKV